MPKKGIVRINQGRILPLWLRLLISTVLFMGMLYANFLLDKSIAVFVSIALAAPVLPIWNAYQLLEINNKSQVYLQGVWLAGFKLGRWKRFRKINEIRIEKAGEISQLKRKSISKKYGAIMVIDTRDQIYLIGSNSRDQLKVWMKEIYDKLQLESIP